MKLESKTDPNSRFWGNLQPFRAQTYLSVPLAKLAIIGIFLLEESEVEASFDNTVVVLYRLFPEKFKLVSFPEHPDFIRVDNTLRLDCRRAHYIIGNRVQGFRLTEHGRTVAQDTLASLRRGVSSEEEKETIGKFARNRATKLIKSVMMSEAYRKFKEKKTSEIQQYDIVDLLHGTLDSDREVLKSNLDQLRFYAGKLEPLREYHEHASDVLQFLSYVELKLGDLK